MELFVFAKRLFDRRRKRVPEVTCGVEEKAC